MEDRERRHGAPGGRDALVRVLERIDGRGYKAYRDAKGRWDFPPPGSRHGDGASGDDGAGGAPHWTLELVHVQADPFAAPSRLRALLPAELVGLPPDLLATAERRVGLACHLARAFARTARTRSGGRGSGKSGRLRMEHPGQIVGPQTAVRIAPDGTVEARFGLGLPARGRRVLADEAVRLLTGVVPDLVGATLLAAAHDPEDLRAAAETNEDAEALRAQLRGRGLMAFVADGAVLPRRSGIDDRPLADDEAVPFASPPSLRVELRAPNAGAVTGMGLPEGVNLIVGGGFHGKSTLLRALALGVYNHRPGDGRERVVTVPDAVTIRAEDGRAVAGVDISAFMDRLPSSVDTTRFSTADASGSTSQAAALMEAVESGASSLLIDEDTAATNFMIRDRRMQALVAREHEPITPLIDRVRELHEAWGVSTVLVVGGSGDWLDVADTVVAMRDYRPLDVTGRAREVAAAHPTERRPETTEPLGPRPRRALDPLSVDTRKGRRATYVRVRGERRLQVGADDLELEAVGQIASRAQLRAIGEALPRLRDALEAAPDLPTALDVVERAVAEAGLDVLDERRPGDLAAFRRHELAAAINRLRGLEAIPAGRRSGSVEPPPGDATPESERGS